MKKKSIDSFFMVRRIIERNGHICIYYFIFIYLVIGPFLVVSELPNYSLNIEEMNLLEEFEDITAASDWIAQEGLKYVAGYVAHRYKEKYAFLGYPARILADIDIDYISILSRGGLLYPSDQMLKVAYVMESEFNAFHGDSLKKEKLIFKTVAENVKKTIDIIPFEVLLCLVRTRTYIRLRNLNRVIFQKSLQQKKKKKMYKMSNKRLVT